jgi:hypothetical protein
LASASAARNARTTETTTTAPTTIRLLRTRPEQVAVDRVAEVGERRVAGDELGREGEDVVAALERGGDHPVDGEDHDREDGEPEQVEADPLQGPSAPAAAARRRGLRDGAQSISPIRTIWRM